MAPAKEASENHQELDVKQAKDGERPPGKEDEEKQEEEKGSPAFKDTPLFQVLTGPLSVDILKTVQDLLANEVDLDASGSFQESYLHVLLAPRDLRDVVVTEKPVQDPENGQTGSQEKTEESREDEMKKEEKKGRVIAALVYQLAAAGMKMNRKDQEGNSGLHIAAINDQPPMVAAALIQVGLDPCLINASEEDAEDLVEMPSLKKALSFYDPGLWRAASENNIKKTKSLLESWCKIEITEDGDDEETLLTMANDKEFFDIVVLLKSHMKTNKLIHAALAGNHEEVKNLVNEGGVNVNEVNKGYFNIDGSQQEMPLLGELVLLGRNDSAKFIVKKGADVNVMVKAGNNNEEPLFYYLLQRCDPLPVDVFKVILKKADFSLVKEKYFTILQNAWERRMDSELVSIMVSRGLNLGIRTEQGYNLRDLIVRETCNWGDTERKQALYFVDEHLLDMAMEGRMDELVALASAGYSYILITNRKGKSIIKFAQKEDEIGIAKFLEAYSGFKKTGYKVYNAILKGNMAEVRDTMVAEIADSCDCLGRSPLQVAVLYERRYIIKWLLKKYPESINAIDQYGRSALHYGYVIPDGEDILQLLIDANGDEQLTDYMGKVPSDYKNQPNKVESERLRPCGIDTLTLDRYLTLRDCIKTDNEDKAIEVIDRIAEFHPRNLMDLPGQFPELEYTDLLFLCEKHKQEETAIALIKAGVPYNHTSQITNEDGSTEVMSIRKGAEYYKCEKLARFLDEYKPESADYESRNGHLALAAAMALADNNYGFSTRGNNTPESEVSLSGSPRPDPSEQQLNPHPPEENPDVSNSSSCVIL